MELLQFAGFMLALIGSVAAIIIGIMLAIWSVRTVAQKLFGEFSW